MFTVRSRLVAAALVLSLGLPAAAESPRAPDAPERAPSGLYGHRYAFVAGGLLLLGGAGFGYLAQGESNRARTLSSASESTAALGRARASAATANVLYGVAGMTLVYGLVLELLPEPAAEKASLTFHF
ncbi:hypothetical protein [Vitiosangium sp. GDMCC 1.1324]|uniref:hypothetical protein n=1 Tax=Vitiosangium sp. (strain GDMCC 1.1324) TaxID=2138576 RepID=UPI000D3D37DF|nr:hypothetical protein [Vitiosangium sp. GDMCC 1.1324]PTL77292.1 hypothetical protein DAT35_45505 [Vitiosangium sp. GDMCC 1.1324]